jgi:GTPase SAR1 family protein
VVLASPHSKQNSLIQKKNRGMQTLKLTLKSVDLAGKTSLLMRHLKDEFPDNPAPTMEDSYRQQTV